MTQNDTNADVKEDFEEIKKDIENLVQRLGSLKNTGGDIMNDQLNQLTDAISNYKQQGKEKSKEMLNNLSSSTREHPLRNLACAFGLGAILSLILK